MLRRHANPQGPPTTSTAGQSDKRYLILTYRAEFDKVHYPLPLQLDERTEEETLRALVGKLRHELAEANETISGLKQGSPSPGHTSASKLEDEHRQLQRRHSDLMEELSQHRRESEILRSELRGLQAERQKSCGSNSNAEPELRRVRDQCQKQQAELKSLREDARTRALNQKREADQYAKDLKAAKKHAESLQAQVRKLEDERRALGLKLQSASRTASAERSRPPSRTPSAERSRPPSRLASRPPARTPSQPRSRATSRASSVASSRDRTPSPNLAGSRGTRSSYDRPWAFERENSPSSTGGRRRQANSPGAAYSPYGQVQSGQNRRRTPSPGQRGRDRTPSPGQQRGRGNSVGLGGPAAVAAAVAGSGAAAVGSRRSAFTLREQRLPPTGGDYSSPSGSRPSKPAASRYGGVGAARPGSASRARDQVGESLRSGSHGNFPHSSISGSALPAEDIHRPGSLFGLAADLGLGPGSLAAAPPVGDAAAAASSSEGGADACDIDARLQALQSFLKQTKTVAG